MNDEREMNDERLQVGDEYTMINETDDYIEYMSGDVKDVDTYTVNVQSYYIKSCDLILQGYSKKGVERKLDIDPRKASAARMMGCTCLNSSFKKYKMSCNPITKFIASGGTNRVIWLNRFIEKDEAEALCKNLHLIADDLLKLRNLRLGLGKGYINTYKDTEVEVAYRVPNTKLFIGGQKQYNK